jgi:CO/xanthine dehydrogenase FAD-binding subunit
MLPNLLEYNWAEDLDEALILLARSDVYTVPLAGGTYLLGHNNDEIQAVIDLRDLQLAYIREDEQRNYGRGFLNIGAMTTLQTIAESSLLREFASGLLARTATTSSASRLIRNSATVGGTLAIGSASQADLLTALAVLDAEVVLRSGSKTQVNLLGGSLERPGLALSGVTFKGKQERRVPCLALSTERHLNELIIEVVIPRPAPSCGGSFMRVGRVPTDVALLHAAALVEVKGDSYQRIHLALGGVGMEPVRLSSVEQQLEGQSINLAGSNVLDVQRLANTLQEGMTVFQPSSDKRATSGYRRVVGMNLAFRALEEATNISRWRNMVSSEGGK